MDIQIVGAEETPDGLHIVVTRTITDDEGNSRTYPERFPKETLAIRAAEYDLEVDDPRVLDQILLEGFYDEANPLETHPLHGEKTIADALAVMEKRVERVRNKHGAPKEPKMRSLFHAAELDESTQGLTDAKRLFTKHADPTVGTWVKIMRDEGRRAAKNTRNPNIIEAMKTSALNIEHDKALAEESIRKGRRPRDSSKG